jgi:hypothetical protein
MSDVSGEFIVLLRAVKFYGGWIAGKGGGPQS